MKRIFLILTLLLAQKSTFAQQVPETSYLKCSGIDQAKRYIDFSLTLSKKNRSNSWNHAYSIILNTNTRLGRIQNFSYENKMQYYSISGLSGDNTFRLQFTRDFRFGTLARITYPSSRDERRFFQDLIIPIFHSYRLKCELVE